MSQDKKKRKTTGVKKTASLERAGKPLKDPARTPVIDEGRTSDEFRMHGRTELPSSDRDIQIRERAYLIFESRGCQHGHALDHWLEAERQVSPSEPSEPGKSAGRSDEAGEASRSK